MSRLCGLDRSRALLRAARYALSPRRRILFTPERPWRPHIIYQLCVLQGYRIASEPNEPHDIVVRFDTATISAPTVEVRDGDTPVINRGLDDISKTRVQDQWESVAGYALRIDPTTHTGPAVCKSDVNATHDGRVIQCPVPADQVSPTHVYQRLIDNTAAPEIVVDHRVVWFGDSAPLVYLKYRSIHSRFSNINACVELRKPADVFSEREIKTLSAFAHAMGLDCGEIDVLRDVVDGCLYVVDVAGTAYGPPNGLPASDQVSALTILAAAFRAYIEGVVHDRPTSR